MKINCLIQNLRDAVQIAERNTSKNQTLPILSSVFIDADGGKIKIKATNLETAVEINVPGKAEDGGSVAVLAKTLSLFLSNLKDEQVILESKKNNLFIKTKTAQTTIRGFSSEDFPLFPKIESVETFSLPAHELKAAISGVAVAVSTSDIKPELSSVLFKVFKNTVKLAATDSFRLAEKTIVSKNISVEKMVSFLIPQRSIQEILKIIENDDIKFGFNKNQIVLHNNNIRFISRLTEGNFPDYEQILPKEFKISAIAEKTDIVSNLKIASIFTGKLNDLNIGFSSEKKSISFQTSNPDIGEHSSELKTTIAGGDEIVKFTWRYILDGVAQINQEYVVFDLNNSEPPLLIHGKGDSSYIYLVMPMKGG